MRRREFRPGSRVPSGEQLYGDFQSLSWACRKRSQLLYLCIAPEFIRPGEVISPVIPKTPAHLAHICSQLRLVGYCTSFIHVLVRIVCHRREIKRLQKGPEVAGTSEGRKGAAALGRNSAATGRQYQPSTTMIAGGRKSPEATLSAHPLRIRLVTPKGAVYSVHPPRKHDVQSGEIRNASSKIREDLVSIRPIVSIVANPGHCYRHLILPVCAPSAQLGPKHASARPLLRLTA
jgi:hypothetical protein